MVNIWSLLDIQDDGAILAVCAAYRFGNLGTLANLRISGTGVCGALCHRLHSNASESEKCS